MSQVLHVHFTAKIPNSSEHAQTTLEIFRNWRVIVLWGAMSICLSAVHLRVTMCSGGTQLCRGTLFALCYVTNVGSRYQVGSEHCVQKGFKSRYVWLVAGLGKPLCMDDLSNACFQMDFTADCRVNVIIQCID